MCLLRVPALPELGNLDRHSLIHARLELRTVTQHEQEFEPDEQRGEEDGLEEVVQEGRGAAFELAVAEELRQPAHNVNDDGDLCGGHRAGDAEVVGVGTRAEADERQRGAGDGLEEDVKAAPGQSCEGS